MEVVIKQTKRSAVKGKSVVRSESPQEGPSGTAFADDNPTNGGLRPGPAYSAYLSDPLVTRTEMEEVKEFWQEQFNLLCRSYESLRQYVVQTPAAGAIGGLALPSSLVEHPIFLRSQTLAPYGMSQTSALASPGSRYPPTPPATQLPDAAFPSPACSPAPADGSAATPPPGSPAAVPRTPTASRGSTPAESPPPSPPHLPQPVATPPATSPTPPQSPFIAAFTAEEDISEAAAASTQSQGHGNTGRQESQQSPPAASSSQMDDIAMDADSAPSPPAASSQAMDADPKGSPRSPAAASSDAQDVATHTVTPDSPALQQTQDVPMDIAPDAGVPHMEPQEVVVEGQSGDLSVLLGGYDSA